MLGVVNHPEYYLYSDQEVIPFQPLAVLSFPVVLIHNNRHSVFLSFILPSNYTIASSLKNIFGSSTIMDKSFQIL